MRSWSRLLLLSVFAVAMGVGSLAVGAVDLKMSAVLASLLGVEGGLSPSLTDMLWNVRAPRIVLALGVGAGLGCAGAGFQGLFRNPLADPFVIGASSGAALGATLSLAFGWHLAWWFLDSTQMAALAGAIAVVVLVYSLASIGRDTPTLALLLAGIAVSSFVGAIVSLVMFLQNQQLYAIFGWLMGSFSGRGWHATRAALPLILLGCAVLMGYARALDSLAFGEETAASLGWHLPRVRRGVIFAASIATAAGVSAGGIIGFVGLIAPHIARLLMGTARHSAVLPASFLMGGIMLLLADDLARTIIPNGELPVGVITSLLGGPFFLYLLRRRPTFLERRA